MAINRNLSILAQGAGSNQTLTLTNAQANALAVGRQGTTNPVLNVDASTASVVTGLNLKGAAAAGGMALSVTSSGTNENLTLDAKGTGTITLNGTATGGITLSRATTMSAALTYGGVTLSNSVTGTGSMVLSAAPALTGAPTITNSSNAFNTVAFTNASTGTGAEAAYRLNNSTTAAFLSHTSTGYTTNSVYRQDGTYLYAAGAGGLTLSTGVAQPIYFAINSSEKARIDSSGNFIVNDTTALFSSKVTFKGAGNTLACYETSGSAAAALICRIDNTGARLTTYNYNGSDVGTVTTNGSTTAYNTSSDYRLKENVQPMLGGLDTISSLKPVIYNWIANGSAGEGFIAHELQSVIPAAVTGKKDAVKENGDILPQGVDMSKIVPYLVLAIQELTARLAVLEAK